MIRRAIIKPHLGALGLPLTTPTCPLINRLQRRRLQHTEISHLPRIAQPSLWEAIFPKRMRIRAKELIRPSHKKPRNPASYFIWIYVLIGSQAIRILGTQHEHQTYMRKAELKIQKLREVVGKLQRGEPVDVEKELGTGDETQEREWEEAMQEIENEERLWQVSKRNEEIAKKKFEEDSNNASPVNESASSDSKMQGAELDSAGLQQEQLPPRAPGFF